MTEDAVLWSLSTLSDAGRKRSREYSICCWSEQDTPHIGSVLAVKNKQVCFPKPSWGSWTEPLPTPSPSSPTTGGRDRTT